MPKEKHLQRPLLFKKKTQILGLNFRGKKTKPFVSLMQRSRSKNKFLLNANVMSQSLEKLLRKDLELLLLGL